MKGGGKEGESIGEDEGGQEGLRRELYLSSSLMYSRMNSEGNFGSFSRWKMFFTFSSCSYQRKVQFAHVNTHTHTHT